MRPRGGEKKNNNKKKAKAKREKKRKETDTRIHFPQPINVNIFVSPPFMQSDWSWCTEVIAGGRKKNRIPGKRNSGFKI